MNDCSPEERVEWKKCAESPDGKLVTYRADLKDKDGTLFCTTAHSFIGSAASVGMCWVPNEVYIVDDTDRSKAPA